MGIAVDGKGNVFIADSMNNVVRLVDSNGTIVTIAGNGVAGYNGDGGEGVTTLTPQGNAE